MSKKVVSVVLNASGHAFLWTVIAGLPCLLIPLPDVFVIGAGVAALIGILRALNTNKVIIRTTLGIFLVWLLISSYPRARLMLCYIQRDEAGMPNCQGINLVSANLQSATLTTSGTFILRNVDFSGADLRWAYLHNVDLSQANLKNADLSDIGLSMVHLNGADLGNANLSNAQMYGVFLNGANLRGANLDGARLEGALYDDQTTWPDGFDPSLTKAKHISK